MIGVLAFFILVDLESGQAGGGVVVRVEISQYQLQSSPLSSGHAAHLLEGPVAPEHLGHADAVEISRKVEMNLVVELCSNCMNCVYNMCYGLFFILAFRRNVDGSYTNSLYTLEVSI